MDSRVERKEEHVVIIFQFKKKCLLFSTNIANVESYWSMKNTMGKDFLESNLVRTKELFYFT